MKRYNTLGAYLKMKYGGKAVKICIDGGFTCPNRDGRAGTGGCVFCGDRGSGEFTASNLLGTKFSGEFTASNLLDPACPEHRPGGADHISRQVRAFMDSPVTHPGIDKFIAYFQSFSNTYAPIPILKARYDAALIDERIAVLDLGTRPDCIDEEIAALLASYRDRCDVWVELGLQTSKDETAACINRGFVSHRFTEAVELLRRYGVEVIAHMIIGLPGETADDVFDTVSFLNAHALSGVKIHSLYVMEDTRLNDLYRSGAYMPLDEGAYVRIAAEAIARLNPQFIVHRITGDCQRDLLVAPAWNAHKIRVIRAIDKYLEDNGWHQGCLRDKGTAPSLS